MPGLKLAPLHKDCDRPRWGSTFPTVVMVVAFKVCALCVYLLPCRSVAPEQWLQCMGGIADCCIMWDWLFPGRSRAPEQCGQNMGGMTMSTTW
jgi:hypothetical protein